MNLHKLILTTTLSALSILGTSAVVEAQHTKPHPDQALLWKVTGKGLTKPVHLFGTIHLGDPSVSTLHPVAQKAFDAAECFYTEIDLSKESQLAITPLIMRTDGKSLNESIGKELASQFDAELQRINPQLTSAPFQTLKTWMAASMPELLPEQLKGLKALDAKLWAAATASGKKILALEKASSQIKAFEVLTEPEQVIYMKYSLERLAQNRAEGVSDIAKLKASYIKGDVASINQDINRALHEIAKGEHPEIGKKLWDSILVKRDKSMGKTIIKTLQENPTNSHFFAVGAAHYCTDTSILFYLKEAGYTLTRIAE